MWALEVESPCPGLGDETRGSFPNKGGVSKWTLALGHPVPEWLWVQPESHPAVRVLAESRGHAGPSHHRRVRLFHVLPGDRVAAAFAL